MPDYGNYCPISLGTEVLADRWTPLILRELIIGSTRFNDIARCLPGISRTLLVQRLRHLERHGVIETWPSPTGRGSEYHLTPAGRDLEPVIIGLGKWAIDWMWDELHPEETDAQSLMWWMHRRIDTDRLPPNRVVIEFNHTAPEKQLIWMVLDRGEASVCIQHPGFDSDVIVQSPTPELSKVFNGLTKWQESVNAGAIKVDGPPNLVKAIPKWFLWSPFAPDVYARAHA